MDHFTINNVIETDSTDFFLLLNDKTQPIYIRHNHHMIYFIREYLKIGYTLYETIRPSTLRHPCIDYRKEKYFKTRDHCIQQCTKIFQRKNCLKLESSKERCSFEFLNKPYTFYDESDYSPRMYPGIKDCNECPQECLTLLFHSTKEKLPDLNGTDLKFYYAPSNTIIRIEFSVKLSVIEFIIYIASCFGLWFGLSVFHGLEELSIKIQKAFDDFKLKRTNQTNQANLIFIQTNHHHHHNQNQHQNIGNLNLINGPFMGMNPIQI